ncbi:MAG: class I SAM-dependent methyltransferase [Desulfovibrio sp.]|jgi:ubiquinone/menaquinone biosynthesis C-methylase UbiE|nr:class I SAM-dependent methyltransferase [Desulfovibrio sp.]
MPRFLYAACGGNDKSRTTREFATEAWECARMDASQDVNPDIVSSLLDMSGVKSGSFDAVYTAHSLERLYAHEVVPSLRNLHRVLKDDGYLVLSSVDLKTACVLIAEDKLLEPAYESPAGPVAPLDILYGFRPALAAGYTRHANNCGFTARALTGTVAQAGFASIWINTYPSTFTIIAIATKNERSEQDMRDLAAKHFGS